MKNVIFLSLLFFAPLAIHQQSLCASTDEFSSTSTADLPPLEPSVTSDTTPSEKNFVNEAPQQPDANNLAAFPGLPGQTGKEPTQEELQKWQEEIDTEITKFVSTLKPQEQEQFYKDVDELTKVMADMNEEQLTDFIGKVFAQEGVQPQITTPAEEVATQKEEIQIEEPKLQEDKMAQLKIDKALKLITNLISRTERFLRTAQRIHELPGKISQWISKDKIKEWQVDLTWNKLKAAIESFNQKLHTLKESMDPKTKKHRYINEFIKNEALYNNVSKLSATLTAQEPKVEAPEFGLTTVTKESRNAIKEVLSAYAEAFYTLNINEDLDKLIATYEPRAKELAAEHETDRKRALEDSKRSRAESPTRIATSPVHTAYTTSAPGGADWGAGSGYGGSIPSMPYTPPAGGDYYAGSSFGAPTGGGYGSASGGVPSGYPGGAGSTAEGGAPEDGGPKSADAKRGEASDKKAKETEAPKGGFQEDADTSRQLSTLDTHLRATAEAIEAEAFQDLASDLRGDAPINEDLIIAIKDVTRSLKKASDSLKAFKLRLGTLSGDQKSTYAKKAKPVIAEHKTLFTDTGKQLEKIVEGKDRLTPAKQYVYFADSSRREAFAKSDPEMAKRVKLPADLGKLAETLQKFSEDVQGM